MIKFRLFFSFLVNINTTIFRSLTAGLSNLASLRGFLKLKLSTVNSTQVAIQNLTCAQPDGRVTLLQAVSAALRILSKNEDELLPLVHKVWWHLEKRLLSDFVSEKSYLIHCCISLQPRFVSNTILHKIENLIILRIPYKTFL